MAAARIQVIVNKQQIKHLIESVTQTTGPRRAEPNATEREEQRVARRKREGSMENKSRPNDQEV